jgi:hypothetical protein
MSQIEETLQRLLAETNEPLHPDLVPYFEKDGALGPQLRHPLVESSVRLSICMSAHIASRHLSRLQKIYQIQNTGHFFLASGQIQKINGRTLSNGKSCSHQSVQIVIT